MRDKNKILIITACSPLKNTNVIRGTAREVFNTSSRLKHFWKMMSRLGTQNFDWAIVSKYGLWFYDEVKQVYDVHPKKYMDEKWLSIMREQLDGWPYVFYYDPYKGSRRSFKYQWSLLLSIRPDMAVGDFTLLKQLLKSKWRIVRRWW